MAFKNSIHFVTRSTVTDGRCKDNTSGDPFSRCKCARIWLQMKLTITEYSLTTSAQLDYNIQKEKKSTLGIPYAW